MYESPNPPDHIMQLSPPINSSEIPHPISNTLPRHHMPGGPRLINQNAYSFANGFYDIKDPATLIADYHTLVYIQHFCKDIAVFLDCLVPTPIFQRLVPSIALTHPALMNAILACGAYTASHAFPDFVGPEVAIKHYNEANALLLVALKVEPRNLELCTLTALCLTIFEILGSVTFELRAHILGVQALLQQFTFHKNETLGTIEFTSSISEASFYLIIHLDLLTSFLLGVVPHWNPRQWSPLVGLTQVPAHPSVHYWYMKVLSLISRAHHLNMLGYDPMQLPTSSSGSNSTTPNNSARRGLLGELYQWASDIPIPLHPLCDLRPVDSSKPFPEIFFSDAGISLAHTYYHSAILTLHDAQSGLAPSLFRNNKPVLDDVDCNYHARRICGIIITCRDMPITITTLWCFLVCSKHIYDVAERKAMIKHMEGVNNIGWSKANVLSEVVASWGGPNWNSNSNDPPVVHMT